MKKKHKVNQERATIITRKNPQLNFGQTVTIVGWNEFSDEVIVIPDGEKKKYIIHYTECWPTEYECDYEAREKQLSANGIWNTASTL
jgi:hypothetical protein